LLVLLANPWAREVFHFSEASWFDVLLSVGVGLLVWVALDVAEQIGLRYKRRGTVARHV
jgi:hypothetical protein